MKGVILRSAPTYKLENELPIRTFARRYAAHTHAQRVCRVSGNGFSTQARPDRCSGRPERAVYSPPQRFRRLRSNAKLVFKIVGLIRSENYPLQMSLGKSVRFKSALSSFPAASCLALSPPGAPARLPRSFPEVCQKAKEAQQRKKIRRRSDGALCFLHSGVSILHSGYANFGDIHFFRNK